MATPTNNGRSPHCLVFPFWLQGHVNPMLQFCHRLRSKGITRITLLLTDSFLKTLPNLPATFPVESISDGLGLDGFDNQNLKQSIYRSNQMMAESLGRLLEKLRASGGADCLIYDAFFPWVLDVAKEFGLSAAPFFTQSNTVNRIYSHAYKGELKLPVSDGEIRIPGGGLPVLERCDMPSFVQDYETDRVRSEFMFGQFVNVDRADWIFVNTFQELEHEVCEWMAKIMPTKPIGPTIPSMYTDKRILDDKKYTLGIFNPVTDQCKEWLDQNNVGSVIYISFGSFAAPGVEQIEELAQALKTSGMKFLWVVRASEESKLPQNYKKETSKIGLIVPWCNQLDVLAHAAVGCFMTHCGWNSTLEALNFGVPMVAVPQWSDQFTNAKCVADVWKVGVRAEKDHETGIIKKEEIVRCLKQVMKGDEIKENAQKWKRLSREAIDDGGSSDNNIQEFVSTLMVGCEVKDHSASNEGAS